MTVISIFGFRFTVAGIFSQMWYALTSEGMPANVFLLALAFFGVLAVLVLAFVFLAVIHPVHALLVLGFLGFLGYAGMIEKNPAHYQGVLATSNEALALLRAGVDTCGVRTVTGGEAKRNDWQEYSEAVFHAFRAGTICLEPYLTKNEKK